MSLYIFCLCCSIFKVRSPPNGSLSIISKWSTLVKYFFRISSKKFLAKFSHLNPTPSAAVELQFIKIFPYCQAYFHIFFVFYIFYKYRENYSLFYCAKIPTGLLFCPKIEAFFTFYSRLRIHCHIKERSFFENAFTFRCDML